MAIYHFNASIIQRSKGQSAVAGAAYISGSSIYEERTGLTHDYSRKRGVVVSDIMAPGLANNWMYDRTELWNRIEEGEKRKDAQIARSIKLALPHELTDHQREDLVFDYARDMFVSRGMVADISIHRPDRHGDERNDHAHIILSMREIEGEGFSKYKQREWNDDDLLETWREEWANYQNRALEKYGHDARVDHRSYEDQGILQEPTHHLGKDASAMERDGNHTRIGDENRAAQEHNQHIKSHYEAAAQVETEISAERERLAQEATRAPLREENPTNQVTERDPQAIEYHTQAAAPNIYSEAIENQFTAPERGASIGELIGSFTGEPPSEAARLAMSGQPAEPPTAASMDSIIQSYENVTDASGTQEIERNNRAWYENLYYNTVETVQNYYSRFVDMINAQRSRNAERDQDEPEPER